MADDSGIRADWVGHAVDWCQGFVGQLLFADINDLPAVMSSVLHDAPVPLNQAESLVLRGILLDLGLRLVRHLHSHEDGAVQCSCSGASGQALMSFWSGLDRDVVRGLGHLLNYWSTRTTVPIRPRWRNGLRA